MKKISILSILLLISSLTACTLFNELINPGDIENILNNSTNDLAIDNQGPELFINSPTNGQQIDRIYQISGTVSDPGSGVKTVYIKIDNGEYFPVAVLLGTWNTTISNLTVGYHTNYIYAEDNAGNVSSVIPIHIIRPYLSSLQVLSPSSGSMTNITNITLSGTAFIDVPYSISKIQVKVNSGGWEDAVGITSWTKDIILSEGLNTCLIRAIANNDETNQLSPFYITLAFPLPSVTITFPMEGAIFSNQYSILVTGTSSIIAPYAVSKVQVKVNNGSWTDAIGTASWSNIIAVLNGTNTITARAIGNDNKTNESSPRKVIIYFPYIFIPHDGAASEAFGNSVALSWDGNTIAVGACLDDTIGAVYLLKWNGTVWLTNKFVASDGAWHDYYGNSIALTTNGKNLLVGAYQNAIGTNTTQGSAYYYQWNGTAWDETNFTAYDGSAGDWYGSSVAITPDGETIVVGACYDTIGANVKQGSVYYYKRNGSEWDVTKFFAFDGTGWDYFGCSVAVSYDGQTIIVGACYDTIGANAIQGSVYSFKWDGSAWLTNKIICAEGKAIDYFGYSVAVSADGNTFAAGAYMDDEPVNSSGSAFLYHWNGSSWDQTAKFFALDGADSDNFGKTVSLSADGTTFIGGANMDDIGANTDQGSAYRFKWNGSVWLTNKIVAYDGTNSDKFGTSVAVSADGKVIAVGASGDNGNKGAAYLYQ